VATAARAFLDALAAEERELIRPPEYPD